MMARRMFSDSFSFENFAEWTPITTSCLSYFFSRYARSGRTCMQLMQQKVQKSRSTTLPRRSFRVISPLVLSQPDPPSRSGALNLRGKGFSGTSPGSPARVFSFSSRLSDAADSGSPVGAGAVFFTLSARQAAESMNDASTSIVTATGANPRTRRNRTAPVRVCRVVGKTVCSMRVMQDLFGSLTNREPLPDAAGLGGGKEVQPASVPGGVLNAPLDPRIAVAQPHDIVAFAGGHVLERIIFARRAGLDRREGVSFPVVGRLDVAAGFDQFPFVLERHRAESTEAFHGNRRRALLGLFVAGRPVGGRKRIVGVGRFACLGRFLRRLLQIVHG